jgi:hypothetical protein
LLPSTAALGGGAICDAYRRPLDRRAHRLVPDAEIAECLGDATFGAADAEHGHCYPPSFDIDVMPQAEKP